MSKVGLGLQEGLPAVGHQVVHVRDRLHGDLIEGLGQFLPLDLVLRDLPRDEPFRRCLDLGIDEDSSKPEQAFVDFPNLGLEASRLAAVQVERFPGQGGNFRQNRIHVFEHGSQARLDPIHELVFADRGAIVAGFGAMDLAAATTVVAVLALGVFALARVVHAAADAAIEMASEGPQLGDGPRPLSSVGGELTLGLLELRVVDNPQ